jgi:hypothetical protein
MITDSQRKAIESAIEILELEGCSVTATELRDAFAIPENGFDYENQAWVVDGRYVSCGHPETMNCGCFGRIHVGESPAANAEIH